MDKFLEMYNIQRLNQEEIDNMNRMKTNNAIDSVIKRKKKNSQQKQSPESDNFMV